MASIMEHLATVGAVSTERSGEPDLKLAVVACMDARMDVSADGFDDVEEDVRQSIARIKANRLLLCGDLVFGFVYDVETEVLRPVSV